HLSSLKGLKLLKVSGSSFFGYVQDEYTTLPESHDRPLFIFLNIGWRYLDFEGAKGNTKDGYVAAEQVRDIAYTVFHEENSPSIQNLIYRIGLRILERFPQLVEVHFESNNRTWETVLDEIPASQEGKVFTEPRPPYGFQCFSMTREDLENPGESPK
ncbi:MAG: urate oxidase, partial [Bacillus sp. (in: firmicutes)]